MLSLYHLVLLSVGSIFWSLSVPCTSANTDTVKVQISDGEILGSRFVSTWTKKTVYSFLGIPYASPPIGDLRFKPPVPPAKWNVTKDCTEFGSSCMQAGFSDSSGSEDCLFLNVYSPELNPSGDLAPVYVWIHGGAFIMGAGSSFGPDPMVAEGVVVVTINYRLGAFGFLSLGTKDMPGNVALFDQVLALKWVKQEISKFGGDPNRVTLGGESAGSMMTHLHYISPVSKGLFQAAIGESGTSLRVMFPDNATEIGLELAKLANCPSSDISAASTCLRDLRADAILNVQNLVNIPVFEEVCSYITLWVPIVDKHSDNPFLPATSEELISQGQESAVPFLMGTNANEGVVGLFGPVNQTLKDLAGNFRYLVPSDVRTASSELSIKEKEDKIRNLYFDGKDPSMSNLLGYIKLFGDFTFVYPTSLSAQYFYNRSSVFLYKFIFDGSFRSTLTTETDQQLQTRFVAHGDELGYLFLIPSSTNQSNADPTSREVVTLNRMVRLWTNFMKHGTPTPSPDSLLQNVIWTPVQNNSLRYLEISDNLTMVQTDCDAQVFQFWNDINSMPSPSSAVTILSSVSLLSSLALLLQLFTFR